VGVEVFEEMELRLDLVIRLDWDHVRRERRWLRFWKCFDSFFSIYESLKSRDRKEKGDYQAHK
jgi:hypothetical protein